MTTASQTRQTKPGAVERLHTAAAEASQVRALSTHPDVVALRVESVRTQVDRCMWVGIVLGLAFTMVNVQAFAAQGAVFGSLPWVAAWLLDPMVSLVLIAVLRAEQITARYQVSDHTRWIGRTKRFAFAATYAMNTWHSIISADVAGIVLHSVPPLLVFCAAETAPVLRDRLTEAVLRAERTAALAAEGVAAEGASHHGTTPAVAAAPVEMPPPADTSDPTDTAKSTDGTASADGAGKPVEAVETAPATKPKPKVVPKTTRPGRKPTKTPKTGRTTGRKLLADYVTEALAAVEPGTAADDITPAWARHTTGCSTGLSAKVATAVRADLRTSTSTPQTSTDDAGAPDVTVPVAA
ncbi:hypothetical protein [Kribbella solani]|uniref:DUF2637 domain-containing protein n=1 Tax=Kribbella solani TaxID=236067 RepID=A0A841DZ94_9ACTN|nr:hypothetical protein [Kribbella solani]MBB5981507.1 hypothetical protein [Kribbella solani]